MSKRILCYGDSNTWGFDPDGSPELAYHNRFAWEVRYPGVLQGLLGEGYRVIEEGHNGRTTVKDDPMIPYRNGMKYIEACIESHAPLDIITIMLGSNDLKPRVFGRAFDSVEGLRRIVMRIKQSAVCGRDGKTPKILLISPPEVSEGIAETCFADEFGTAAYAESLKFPRFIKAVAEEQGCAFLDAARYTKAGSDGLHITAACHTRLAEAIAEAIKAI